MERQTSSTPESQQDAVEETLERLEVADTLEELRHHIDELIDQLSEKEHAAASQQDLSPELEGQLESLGDKVESASELLTELTDLLEAQTERIETIEQQLGDPDLGLYPSEAPARAVEQKIPTFSMRPGRGSPTPPAEPAPPRYEPDPTIALREYLDIRLERLEAGIRQIERRVSEIRGVAEERERQVRELEERLLILVDAGVSHEPAPAAVATKAPSVRSRLREHGAHALTSKTSARRSVAREDELRPGECEQPTDHEPRKRAHGRTSRRQLERRARQPRASEQRSAPLESRPQAMPLFVHQASGQERRVVRKAAATGHARSFAREPRKASARDAWAGHDAPTTATHMPLTVATLNVGGEQIAVAREHASPGHEPATMHVHRNGSASSSHLETMNGEASALRLQHPTNAPVPEELRASLTNGSAAHDPMHELERLVERDIRLQRDFGGALRDGVRRGKAHPVVLVVDDAPDALKLLSIYLSRTGYQVVTASSAEDCLAKLRHHHVDALVLDAKMPGANGGHVCRVLHEDPAYMSRRHVPVIVYTGYPDEYPSDVRSNWGAAEYVVKGGDMLPLITALVRHTTAEPQ